MSSYNERIAYTSGWKAGDDGGKKGDCPFAEGSRLRDIWLKGRHDSRKGRRDETLFREE